MFLCKAVWIATQGKEGVEQSYTEERLQPELKRLLERDMQGAAFTRLVFIDRLTRLHIVSVDYYYATDLKS